MPRPRSHGRRGSPMRRREFITLIGGAVAWPVAARAQQGRLPVIGFRNTASPAAWAHLVAAFHEGLNALGYVEHRSVGLEYRWAEGQYDRLPALAPDLVGRQVVLIAATGGTRWNGDGFPFAPTSVG